MKPFVADLLAVIIATKHKENKINRLSIGTSDDDISETLKKLEKLYRPFHMKFINHRKAERNKVRKTPTLDYQKSSTHDQDAHQFDKSNVYADHCLARECLSSTMPLEFLAVIHTDNEARRVVATSNGGDGKFKARSTKVGCFCYQGPLANCMCQVTFEEAQRHSIALALQKNKKTTGRSATVPQPGTSSALLYNSLNNYLQGNALQQMQSTDPGISMMMCFRTLCPFQQ